MKYSKVAALVALGIYTICAALEMSSITAGWENSNPDRREFPATAAVWTAPKDGLRVVMSGGAEGDVSFKDGEIKIRKTNNRGRIVVRAPEATFRAGQLLRFMADVEVKSANPDEALCRVRIM